MSDLKSQLIKLGSTNPELRPHIRKILSAAGSFSVNSFQDHSRGKKNAATLQVGDTFENDIVRIHQYNDYVHVTLLENAGRRGKKVDKWSIGNWRGGGQVYAVTEDLMKSANSVPRVMAVIKAAEKGVYGNDINVEHTSLRGVDVTPAGFKPVEISTSNLYIKASFNDFVVRDLLDQYNEQTCIPAIKGGKKDIKVFYKWVKDNERALRSMKFSDVVKGMNAQGIDYHYYCAMD